MRDNYTETHHDRRKVGECPACRYPLFADVILTTELSPPRWSDSLPAPHADVSVKVTGMSLNHVCNGGES